MKQAITAIGGLFIFLYFVGSVLEEHQPAKEVVKSKPPAKEKSPVYNIPPKDIKKHYTKAEAKRFCEFCIEHFNCKIKQGKQIAMGVDVLNLFECYGPHTAYVECDNFMTFLKTNFINKKAKDKFFNADYKTYPKYLIKCPLVEKAYCQTKYCKENNPKGFYYLAKSSCSLKGDIARYRFLKDAYCGPLYSHFFKELEN